MTDYIIRRTDPANGYFIIRPHTANGPDTPNNNQPLLSGASSANTPLKLYGRGKFAWGEGEQTNMVQMLENFANQTPPSYPLDGQLWFNNNTNLLSIKTTTGWTGVITNPLQTNLNANNHRIINVLAPSGSLDGANKQYVDSGFLSLNGGTITGNVTISGGNLTVIAPVSGGHTTNKTYVDSAITTATTNMMLTTGNASITGVHHYDAGSVVTFVSNNVNFTSSTIAITGSTVWGGGSTINFGNNVIHGGATPLVGTDLANKAYVDATVVGASSGSLIGGTFDGVDGSIAIDAVPLDITISNLVTLADVGNGTGHILVSAIDATSHNSSLISTNQSLKTVLLTVDDAANQSNVHDRRLFGQFKFSSVTGYEQAAFQPITAVTAAGPDTFVVAGDLTNSYIPGGHITVSSNDFTDANKTYQISAVNYSVGLGTTTITTITDIPSGTTASGQINAVYGGFVISGIRSELLQPNSIVLGITGVGALSYTIGTTTEYSGTTIIEMTNDVPVASVTGSCTIGLQTISLPFRYIPGTNRISLFVDGIKKYKDTRGRQIYNLTSGTKATDPANLSLSVTYSCTIDTSPSTTPVVVNITIPTSVILTIAAVHHITNRIVVAGNHTDDIYNTQTLTIVDSTPTSGSHTNIDGNYVVSGVIFDGTNTVITTSTNIPDPVTFGSGMTATAPVYYSYANVVTDINTQLTTASSTVSCAIADSRVILSTSGTSTSQTISVVDSVTNGLFAALSPVAGFSGYPPSANFYREVGKINLPSTTITINSAALIAAGTSDMMELVYH
jgi:hypothetical protein